MRKIIALMILCFFSLFIIYGKAVSNCYGKPPVKAGTNKEIKQKVSCDEMNWRFDGFFIKI